MKKITAKELKKKHWPQVLIAGMVVAGMIGVGTKEIKDYYQYKQLFPDSGVVETVVDGDTVELASGLRIRMLGINAPDRGEENFDEATSYLKKLTEKQKVWLEYDRYQDDKNGRILAYLWVKCETEKPKFLPADHMHLDGKTSRDFVIENPEGCKNGIMLNRKLVEDKFAVPVVYEGRGRLKYNFLFSNTNFQ